MPPPEPSAEAQALAAEHERRVQLERLNNARVYITKEAVGGRVSIREYRRVLVKLAWGYALVQGDASALDLLSYLPADYLAEDLPQDAVRDSELLRSAESLAEWLVQRGHVDPAAGEEPCMPVMAIGRA